MYNFASVFHGIRFKVKRLFVGMTDNFFIVSTEAFRGRPIMYKWFTFLSSFADMLGSVADFV